MPEAGIAVVIPAYNAGSFLADAIESVLAQTLVNWTCVIVDDGSTDQTPFLLQSYQDSRIKMVRQENKGEGQARFQGVLLTQPPKIVFLDADDRLLPDALARFSSFLDEHPSIGVAYGERILIDKEGRRIGRGGAFLNAHPEGDVLEAILRRPFLSTPSQACLRREAIPPSQWFRDRGRSGDWLLLAGAAIASRFAYMGKSPLVEYRIHGGSQLRSVARHSEGGVDLSEYEEVLDHLFALPGLETRFDSGRRAQLRQAASASCLAIKGQEFLRRREYGMARRYFRAALKGGSRDFRDVLCWIATFSPFLLRWGEPLYGTVDSKDGIHLPNPPNH